MKKTNEHKKVELPKCHECGTTADVVYENEYWTYTFDEKTKKYVKELVDIEVRCPNCNARLHSEFPEGVCNFKLSKVACTSH